MFELVQEPAPWTIDGKTIAEYPFHYKLNPPAPIARYGLEWDAIIDLVVTRLKEVRLKLKPKECVIFHNTEVQYGLRSKIESNEYCKSYWTCRLITQYSIYQFAYEFTPKRDIASELFALVLLCRENYFNVVVVN